MKLLSSLIVAAFLAGCSTAKVAPIALSAPFDASQAYAFLEPGTNTISGSALIRQNGGGVVTCAGLEVQLVPSTAYATERVQAIYGNSNRGYRPIVSPVTFTPDYPEYQQATRRTLCDAQGRFEFSRVKDGTFYVVTIIVWQAGNMPQGGVVMAAAHVSGGEAEQVVLSP